MGLMILTGARAQELNQDISQNTLSLTRLSRQKRMRNKIYLTEKSAVNVKKTNELSNAKAAYNGVASAVPKRAECKSDEEYQTKMQEFEKKLATAESTLNNAKAEIQNRYDKMFDILESEMKEEEEQIDEEKTEQETYIENEKAELESVMEALKEAAQEAINPAGLG